MPTSKPRRPTSRSRYVPRQILGAFHFALFQHAQRVLVKARKRGDAVHVVDCTAGSALFELGPYADTTEVVDSLRDLSVVLERHDQHYTEILVFAPGFVGTVSQQEGFIEAFLAKGWKSRVWFVQVEASLHIFRRDSEHWAKLGEIFSHPFYLWEPGTLDRGMLALPESIRVYRPDRGYGPGFESEHWVAAAVGNMPLEFGVQEGHHASRTGRHVHEGPGRVDEGILEEDQGAGEDGG